MTYDDIIRIARKAGWSGIYTKPLFSITMQEDDFLRFAALVAAAERERMKSEGWRHCAEGQITTQYCGLLEAAVKAEREVCEKLCEEIGGAEALDCAADIRARGTE